MKKILISSIFSFISILLVAGTNILPPQLVSPVNNAVKQMPNVTLDWYAVSGTGVINYLLEVDNNDNFTDPLSFNLTVTSKAMEMLRFGQSYYWRVKAIDDNGESDWSATFTFSVFEQMLLNKPDDGATARPPTIALSWKPAISGSQLSGFDFIDIMYDTSNYWEPGIQNITTDNLFGVYFVNPDLGYVSAESGQILKFDNGSWSIDTIWYYNGTELADTTIGHDLLAMKFNDSGLGYIAGEHGTLIQFDGTHWVLEPIMVSGNLYIVNLTTVAVIDEDQVWVCNDDGGILTKTSSGWDLADVGSDPYLALSFVDASNGWAVGEKGQIAFYNGSSWTELESINGDDLFAIDFSAINNGYAAGESGTILNYNGTEWTEMESNTSKDLFFLNIVNDNDIWAGGELGRLAYYDGSDWVELTSSSIVALSGFYGIDENNGWMVGENGTLIQRNPNGFNSPEMHLISTPSGNLTKTISELYFGEKYYWRIRARHGADTSNWSASQFFTTLSKPTLVSPANNASHQMINLLLDWDGISGVYTYIVQLCDEPTFAGGCTFYSEKDSLRTENLLFGTTYYWHVKAAHNQDTTDWSDARSFTTLNQVNLVSPANGSFVPELFPTLEWEEINGVDGFKLEYGVNENFVGAEKVDIASQNTSFKVLFALQQDLTYFWKIKAYRDGDTTLWSQVWSFTIGEDTIGGIQNAFNERTVNLYPNPSKTELFIDVNVQQKQQVNVIIMDVLGKTAIEKEFTFESGMNTRRIDTSELNNGLYIVKIQSGDSYYSLKILIDK